jgi:hypothetical protein
MRQPRFKGSEGPQTKEFDPKLPKEASESESLVDVPAEETEKNIAEKWFDWNITSGDCTLKGARLILRSDGTATFAGVTRSSDSDDTWRMRFEFKKAQGVSLGIILPLQPGGGDRWYTNNMPNGDTDYSWNFNTTYDSHLFPATTTVVMWRHC